MGDAVRADLEGALDRLIGKLAKPGAPREAKALLLDARRLRTLVGNWRTISPTDEARKEMGVRVEQLERSTDALLPSSSPPVVQRSTPVPVVARSAPPPVVQRSTPVPVVARSASPRVESVPAPARKVTPQRAAIEWEEPPSLVVPPRTLLDRTNEPTRAAPARTNGVVDPERPRTLPDLDISGIAQLLEDGPPVGFDDTLDTSRATAVARNTRVDFDDIARRPASDPPPRPRPNPTPANGRRRVESPTIVDPTKATGRPSRILLDADGEGGEDLTGRVSPRPSSAPPLAARSDKTLIAVRPLPAPEVLDKRLVMLTDPYSAQADAYRALRRKLSGAGAPRTIAITSAQPGEGKTSCAVNLALAFRETSSERVLLLEANLRAPVLAKLFGFEPPVCFARQMAKNRDSARASWTVVEQFEPLHVLAVDPSSKTSPLLDPVAFANALEQLVEAGYDHIIVDTPPALGGSDVNLIADAVDGIVVAVWIKKSKRSLVKKAIEQLKPATILGVVTLEG